MFTVYTSNSGAKQEITDFVTPICNEKEMELADVLASLGYRYNQSFGNDSASIEVYTGEDEADYAALVIVGVGAGLQWYAMPKFHDLLDFLREYAATIKALADLADYV
ncbi:hypothetical protein OR590_002833 [Pseudomonas aeruginosa]|uniref:hypothetical protein n=1 Tax=Pseudomonas aeruginosa TaxID=287 RepID=UPI0007A037E6|nr:hypothetical protein [Pseudomonas aeruginosa]EJK6085893.1 hypothetical protein [Pseudomonas aeruginosa]EKD5495145.1 hypothetical protein [Pseudomonas aeruginosa]EKD5525000.1 hypothetical protein [Pseudomonas aeruginosa]EKD5562767.1 hypothetical protein [Pseudomonas aeruginosa]EKD5595677.1 hypothetical protein [Pseudomonas aeruginosa]